jgi:hypothetical protein
MLIWLALLIPIIGGFIAYRWFHKELVWFELVIPFTVSFLFILIFKFSIEKIQTSDTEYQGATVVEARYYEYWETWVHKTCYRTVKCGKSTITVPYDCSYCDENPERWTLVNSLGYEYRTTKKEYERLIKKWEATPQFVELNRSINYHFSRGKDGDMYKITWNKKPETALATSWTNDYENRIQAAHTAFDFAEVKEEDKKRYELYDYPEVNSNIQPNVLGQNKVPWLTFGEKERLKCLMDYTNGQLGPKKHARVYLLFFVDKPAIAANMQEAYWDGGNDNELVVCIGLSKRTRDIQWVRPFSWSPNRRIIPDVREEISNLQTFKVDSVSSAIYNNVDRSFERKDFKEFSYVTVDPPTWAIRTTFIVTLIITIATLWWGITNDSVNSNYYDRNDYRRNNNW